MPPEYREFLHKTRLYYHELSDNDGTVDYQAYRDVFKSNVIHLKGKLAGLTKNMYNLLPPGNSIEFKFTKANERFYIIRHDTSDEEYKVEIVSAFLHLTRVQLSEKAKDEFMARWKRERFYYIPYTRSDVSLLITLTELMMVFTGAPEYHHTRGQVTHNSKLEYEQSATSYHPTVHGP